MPQHKQHQVQALLVLCLGRNSVAVIPTLSDPTLDAMRRVCEVAGNNSKPRDYLGASLIGDPCSRKIWYSYKNYPKEPFSANTLWNFEDGHRTEDLIASRLRMVKGIELWTHDANGNQYGFSALGGKFKGHCDGVILGLLQAPKTPHVWECKASAQKKFEEFKKAKASAGEKGALKLWNESYYIQGQLYMHYLQLDRHYLTVALAGGRDIDSCRTEYDADVALRTIDKADLIINATREPARISEKADFWLCKFCDYRGVCHGEKEERSHS